MANREHVEVLRNGALEWNAWRQEHPRIRPDLRGAHLAEATLRRYDLRGADFRGASLLAANLDSADLRRADLSECDLRYCTWNGARLTGAKLRDARGLDPSLLKAAERVDWRERLRSMSVVRVGVALAVLAVGWAAAKQGLPERASGVAAPAIELAAVLSESRTTRWEVQGVAISGGLLRVRLDSMDLPEEAYLDVLTAACRTLDGREVAPPVERIEVLRLDGEAGWQFEPAERCAAVLKGPAERAALVIAAASTPIRPKPSPAAALRGAR